MLRAIERFSKILDEYPDVKKDASQRSDFIDRIGIEYGIDEREPAATGIYRILDGIRSDVAQEMRK